MDEERSKKPKLVEHTETLQLFYDDEQRNIKISSILLPEENDTLVQFLKAYSDVFAWSAADMLGIDLLNVLPEAKLVKKKNMRQEVTKLLSTGFIREVEYLDWVSNMVMVKKNGKWRMCIDSTNLNKACSKDSFPLPSIDRLVDASAGHKFMSFMDAFLGYNQILFDQDDQEKITFITNERLFYYRVMPFGLKNIGHGLEIFVGDMLVKSATMEEHMRNLSEVFVVLRTYNMKLNPEKCAFSVRAGRFLSFMISEMGIEVNPKKIHSILEMPPPQTIIDIRHLTGKIVALNRFISRMADKCLYLQDGGQMPSILQSPDDLFFETIAVVLVKTEGVRQFPIYYISKVLQNDELRYSKIEKFIFALIVATRKLRPYF
ncbi:Retrovirus-related Pol polyprotein from transposon opus [Gossypium australe]|uniref:Retrovirus-related Pol polyprotein from transposon opus n=1 Tax=Gossypium australe TaxID=47621 RepID=A0A5B6VK01_9ROSI|nr:Retrovirus-related Pol polyprotein from transposon opus [Gossypium australe]